MVKKYQEDFNFIKCGQYDVSSIKNIVESFDDEWKINTVRQTRFTTHMNTESYFIYETSLHWKPEDRYSVEQKSDNGILLEAVEPIVKDLELKHDGVRGQVLIIKLKANTDIPPHTDKGSYLLFNRRHHIPIITSDNTKFGVGDEEIHMSTGECWEINNARTHYVNNNSDVDRIHLLVDIMPNREIK